MPEGKMSGRYRYDYNAQLGQNAHRGNSPRCADDYANGQKCLANTMDGAEQLCSTQHNLLGTESKLHTYETTRANKSQMLLRPKSSLI